RLNDRAEARKGNGSDLAAALARRSSRYHAFAKIKRIGSGQRMLAAIRGRGPASVLKHNIGPTTKLTIVKDEKPVGQKLAKSPLSGGTNTLFPSGVLTEDVLCQSRARGYEYIGK